MLQYAIYSVISPEGCASILWKDAARAEEAAAAMGITSERVLELGLIDTVIEEPLGGAHRDPELMAERLKAFLIRSLDELQTLDADHLIRHRQERLMAYGPFRET